MFHGQLYLTSLIGIRIKIGMRVGAFRCAQLYEQDLSFASRPW